MSEADQKAKELMNELSKFMDTHDQDPIDTLFHYTSFENLSNILKTKQLWLTNHKYLNDPSEIAHGKKILIEHMKTKLLSINPSLYYQFIGILSDIIDNSYHAFVTSFCEQGDYLPAWRYYGHDGAGFSIGFKKDYFFRMNPQTQQEKVDSTLLFKVEYEKDSSTQVNDIINKADEIYPDWNKKSFTEVRPYLATLACNLLTILPCIKNEDYRDEHEWRLCMIRLFHERSNEWYPAPLPMDRLIISNRNSPPTVPFLKDFKTSIPRIKSKEFSYNNIDCIYVGPRVDFIAAKLAIEKILVDEGLPTEEIKKLSIKKSDRPYQ